MPKIGVIAMTNEEAIAILCRISDRMWLAPYEHKAINKAIKAIRMMDEGGKDDKQGDH